MPFAKTLAKAVLPEPTGPVINALQLVSGVVTVLNIEAKSMNLYKEIRNQGYQFLELIRYLLILFV